MNDKNIKAYLHTTIIAIATNEIIDQYKMDTKQAQWIKVKTASTILYYNEIRLYV